MRLLVALDGSDESLAGLEWVASLPLGSADMVVLLSVAEPDAELLRRSRRLHERHLALLLDATWEARRGEARLLLADAGSGTLGWATPVRQVVREGHPVEAVLRVAQEVDAGLVVVGPRGRGRVAALVLGSVTQSLLGVLDRPLLIARRPVAIPDPVLVAIDGSEHGDTAIACVAGLRWLGRAAVTVLTVVPTRTGRGLAGRREPVVARAERDLAREIAEAAATALRTGGRATDARVAEGDPSRTIVGVARSLGAGLVVVGTRGAGGFHELLAGSVAQRVAATASCAVLAVPARKAAPAGG